MKYCFTVLIAALALHIACAAQLRVHRSPVHVASHTLAAATTSKHVCDVKQGNAAASISHSNNTVISMLARQSAKLRVCNAVLTEREALLSVWLNGKQLKDAMKGRHCIEFDIPVAATNKFEVKLTGEVTADWSEEKSQADMANIPVLFLVAHVFGQGDDTTFSVDQFHGENTGLKSVQVAYMDVFRGAPDAKLQLIGSAGEFEMGGGTFITMCAGEYSLRYVRNGQVSKLSTPAHFKIDEQYIVLRLAPEKHKDDRAEAESAVVFPLESAPSWFPSLSR